MMNAKKNSGAPAAWLTKAGVYKLLGMLIAVLMLSFLCAAQSSDEPLADVARQNKPNRKAARVVTNDEIPGVAVSVTNTSSAASTPDNKDAAENTDKSASVQAAKDDASKSSKSSITVPGVLANGNLQQARAALETLKHDRQAFIANYDKIERRLAETDNEALRQSYTDILATRDKTLARNAQQMSDLESAIHAAQDASGQGGNNETQ